MMKKIVFAAAFTVACSAGTLQAKEISDEVVKIGVMADMGGPYADACGKGCVAAVELAIEDFGGAVLGKPIKIISADDQNKPDVGSATVRKWVDVEKVDMVTWITSSAVGLAAGKVLTDVKKPMLVAGAGSPAFTTSQCSPYNIHWTYDVIALANGTVKPLVDAGNKKWFFITVDYVFGHALEKVSTGIIEKSGAKVVGSVKVPLGTTDFSSYILQAQSSGADAVAFANVGKDFTNALKGASEFGLNKQATMVGLLVFTSDVQAINPKTIADMRLTTGYAVQRDDKTKAWGKRYKDKFGKTPTMIHAGAYSATMHYLKAVKATGTDDGSVVMAEMKKTKPDDFFAQNASLRADGRMIHDMYQVRVKKESERVNEDDLFEIENTLAGSDVFLPMMDKCDFNK